MLSPYILLLRTTADAIDDYVKDFRDIGFYILEVTDVEGGYVIPTDADRHPIKLLVSPAVIAANIAIASTTGTGRCVNASGVEMKNDDGSLIVGSKACEAAGGKWDMSVGGHGLGGEFVGWAKEFLGEEDILLTGPQKAIYEVEVGKSEPPAKRTSNANDNKMSKRDEITGMYKMTPSQVIATIIAAMDDKFDSRRPTFSSTAEAGAVVVLVGVSDLTKNLANLKSIVDAFNVFFCGDQRKDKNGKAISPTGVAGGMAKLGGLINAALLQLDEPKENNVTLKVNNVCIARGTEEQKKDLIKMQIPYIVEGGFELNDFVVGPRVKFGARCQGYVSEIKSTEEGDEIIHKQTGKVMGRYKTQELVITGITGLDAVGFKNLGSGAKLQRVAYVKRWNTFVDQNGGKMVSEGPFNDFEYLPNLPVTKTYNVLSDDGKISESQITYTAEDAGVKVKRKEGESLLTVLSNPNKITEEHYVQGEMELGGPAPSTKITTHNVTVGDILEEKTPDAPHPNFKAVKLDDLIGDFKTFFMAIDALTDSLRKMADDAAKAIQDIIDYLDAKNRRIGRNCSSTSKNS